MKWILVIGTSSRYLKSIMFFLFFLLLLGYYKPWTARTLSTILSHEMFVLFTGFSILATSSRMSEYNQKTQNGTAPNYPEFAEKSFIALIDIQKQIDTHACNPGQKNHLWNLQKPLIACLWGGSL